MRLVLLKAVYEPVHHHQLISRRKVLLNCTSAACCLHRGGIVSFVFVTGGIPPVSVASHNMTHWHLYNNTLAFIQQQTGIYTTTHWHLYKVGVHRVPNLKYEGHYQW